MNRQEIGLPETGHRMSGHEGDKRHQSSEAETEDAIDCPGRIDRTGAEGEAARHEEYRGQEEVRGNRSHEEEVSLHSPDTPVDVSQPEAIEPPDVDVDMGCERDTVEEDREEQDEARAKKIARERTATHDVAAQNRGPLTESRRGGVFSHSVAVWGI